MRCRRRGGCRRFWAEKGRCGGDVVGRAGCWMLDEWYRDRNWEFDRQQADGLRLLVTCT